MTTNEENIKVLRLVRNGRSQREVGLILGRNQTTISRYLNGIVPVPGDIVDKCMHILHEDSGDVTAAKCEHLEMNVHASELSKAFVRLFSGEGAQEAQDALFFAIEWLNQKKSG